MILLPPATFNENQNRFGQAHGMSSTLPSRHRNGGGYISGQRTKAIGSNRSAPNHPAPVQSANVYRSHTIDRFGQRHGYNYPTEKQLKQVAPNSIHLERNRSALGFVRSWQSNGVEPVYSKPESCEHKIYAPASIASPREFTQRSATLSNGTSQHYAATSIARPRSESGRESSLSSVFGTLRRKAKRALGRLSNNNSNRRHSNDWETRSAAGGISHYRESTPAPPQNIYLDPEIYGPGKREVKADEIYAEGLMAIDSNMQKKFIEWQIDKNLMNEGELRVLVSDPSQPDYIELICMLKNWINDELSNQRIIVRDLQEDLYDGQVLGKLVEKLHRSNLDLVEVTQNEMIQKQKLQTVLSAINRILSLQARWARIRWSVEGIHKKNIVEIIYLLVTLAIYHRAPVKLPPNVTVTVIEIQKFRGELQSRTSTIRLTDVYETSLDDARTWMETEKSPRERDAFVTLVEQAPDKIPVVKRALAKFANRHLNKVNLSCLPAKLNPTEDSWDPDQFSDGILLVFLMASLEDYFVPLGNLFTAAPDQTNNGPRDAATNEQGQSINRFDINKNGLAQISKTAIQIDSYTNTQSVDKLHNVNFAFQLMEEAGIEIRKLVRAEDIVNGDLISVLRVLYTLFGRYRRK